MKKENYYCDICGKEVGAPRKGDSRTRNRVQGLKEEVNRLIERVSALKKKNESRKTKLISKNENPNRKRNTEHRPQYREGTEQGKSA